MVMAQWGEMTWGVSPEQIAFLESFTASYGVEVNTNADKDGNSPTEKVAQKLVEFSLSTTYMVETGTRDVRGVVNRWSGLVGKVHPLIIGIAAFGPGNMMLMSVSVSNVRLTADGTMKAATIDLQFKEYSEDDKSYYIAPEGSAVNISCSYADRENKKTLSI